MESESKEVLMEYYLLWINVSKSELLKIYLLSSFFFKFFIQTYNHDLFSTVFPNMLFNVIFNLSKLYLQPAGGC